jgi:hypothetical protein
VGIIQYHNEPIELLGTLTIGSVANFLGWCLIVTGIIALWRKSGEKSWGRPVLVIGFILLIITGIMVFYSIINRNSFSIFAPHPTLTPIPTPTPAPIVLYSDDFSNSQSGWGSIDFLGLKHQYLDGKYVISIPNMHNVFTLPCANRNFTDAVLTVDAEYVSGDADNNGPLVIWRSVDINNFYALGFSGANSLSVLKRFNGQWLPFVIVIAPLSDPINGENQINKIAISFKDGISAIYINGKFVTSIQDSTFISGDVCLGAMSSETSPVEVSFDNLVVYTIDSWTPPK